MDLKPMDRRLLLAVTDQAALQVERSTNLRAFLPAQFQASSLGFDLHRHPCTSPFGKLGRAESSVLACRDALPSSNLARRAGSLGEPPARPPSSRRRQEKCAMLPSLRPGPLHQVESGEIFRQGIKHHTDLVLGWLDGLNHMQAFLQIFQARFRVVSPHGGEDLRQTCRGRAEALLQAFPGNGFGITVHGAVSQLSLRHAPVEGVEIAEHQIGNVLRQSGLDPALWHSNHMLGHRVLPAGQ